MRFRILIFVLIVLAVFTLNSSAAVYTVINVLDDGNPGCLRWAMNMANGSAGMDTIDFNIPGGGVHTITPGYQLPVLIDPSGTMINGLTQPGASAGGNPPSTAILMIEINGIGAGASHGIWIQSPNNIIQGLVINNFEQDGIRIQGMIDPPTFLNFIYCNFVGTDPTGTVAQGNGWNYAGLWAGIDIVVSPDCAGFAYDNIIESNVSSANFAEGVAISNCPPGDVHHNFVLHNYIGTDLNGFGAGLGNINTGITISEGAHNNEVADNIISDNGLEGVCIVGFAELGIHTDTNHVFYNTIGLDINFAPLANGRDGVSIGHYAGTNYRGGHARRNLIEFNTIAYNTLSGVMIWEHQNTSVNADENRISQNSIYDNGTLGIDLQDDMVTLNDYNPDDLDNLANQLLNFPDSLLVNYIGGVATISGILRIDTPPTSATVEVFKARLDPSGYGEGENFLGMTTPDAAGNWSISVPGLSPGDYVTATAIDANNNTSEFSPSVMVASDTCLTCIMDIRPDLVPCDNSVPIQFQLDVTNCGSVAVPVYAEIYPTIGDCTSGSSFDFNINRLVTSSLPAGQTYSGYYYYYAGNRCAMGLSLVAIWVDVGPAINNWIGSCCDNFFFTNPFAMQSPVPGAVWGEEGSMFYETSELANLPDATSLGQNYPNPFNAATVIPFSLKESGHVSLRIYNLAGQVVETLVDDVMTAGSHNVNWGASQYATGIYFYTLNAEDVSFTKKLILVK
ncbi:MAG: T9SS type A sorting domain-containing protein [candidate division Zixibacteria bacterium]|nr:T9SS type A sorting domain-containing protein [candidate division Zixibacteria bacterium]